MKKLDSGWWFWPLYTLVMAVVTGVNGMAYLSRHGTLHLVAAVLSVIAIALGCWQTVDRFRDKVPR